tara:strand:+ start:616 stop:807 length:192 start_codon:yes stop_codon:yes gene_type:complete
VRQSSTVSLENLAVRLAIEAGVGALGLTRLSSLGLIIIDYLLDILAKLQQCPRHAGERNSMLN